eukprot:TRINITY_DN1008_c0_g1_i3.p1 TRINITY_DN1008_c0_g1~~TRINITY_DN1008_c0_g1_i3.p1  ORF type:complete len:126 (+),score=11.61 TRINITY_DN1008_c0_g1_i3:114-491(+)
MIRRPPRSTLSSSSAASDVYKRQSLFTPLTILFGYLQHYLQHLASTIDLLAVGAALSEAALSASRLAQSSRACAAEDNCLRVPEHRGDVEASRTLDVHEERVWRLHKALKLVLLLLLLSNWVKHV